MGVKNKYPWDQIKLGDTFTIPYRDGIPYKTDYNRAHGAVRVRNEIHTDTWFRLVGKNDIGFIIRRVI